MLRERLLFGLQVFVALALPFVLFRIDPPAPLLWSIVIFVIVLFFALINTSWAWLVLGAVIVNNIPNVFDLGRATDPFLWGSLCMSIGVLIAVPILQPMRDRPMFRPQSPSRRPLFVAIPAVLIAAVAIITFALLFNRSTDAILGQGQEETVAFFERAPSAPVGVDDGTSPILQTAAPRIDDEGDIGPVIAALEFRQANGRSIVSRDPVYVRAGINDETLALGLGSYPLAAKPGAPGNLAIAGHRRSFGAPLQNLDRLDLADLITATDLDGNTHTYEVVSVRILPAEAQWALNPDPLRSGQPTVTLTTYEPSDEGDQRLVVFATLQNPS